MCKVRGFYHVRVWALLALISTIAFSGCSKKSVPTAGDSSAAAAAPAATNDTAAAAATEPTSQAPTGPALDASQMGDAKQAMADADAALRQRDYEKAVRTMMAIQQAQLSAQQAEAARQQMYNLQRNLANAVASGDPNAKAAADILRASRGH